MSAIQTMAEQSPSQDVDCEYCGAVLPPRAVFCGACGERVDRSSGGQAQDAPDVAERYRITRLVRRSPYVQLFLATDNQHQRPVAIRDIDISSLDDESRESAISASQQEYDLLRCQRVPNVMPVIDLRYFQGHLFVVMGWPFQIPPRDGEDQPDLGLYTLQDLLQSGIGRPSEAVATSWIYQLCLTVDRLHKQQMLLGDLGPYTIVVSDNDYRGKPALLVSWLPIPIRDLLLSTSTGAHKATHFSAPEAVLGMVEPRSDIYSLGAILYLLVTGRAPDMPTLRSEYSLVAPREINPHVSSDLEEVITRALALDPASRFHNAEEMALALQHLQNGTIPASTDMGQGASSPPAPETVNDDVKPIDDSEDVTISVVPLQSRLAHWYLTKMQAESTQEEELAQTDGEQRPGEDAEAIATATEQEPLPEPMPRTTQVPGAGATNAPLLERVKQRVTGVLPAFSRQGQLSKEQNAATPTHPESTTRAARSSVTDNTLSFFKRLQRFILGEQQRSTTAAALIETPLRVQPNQGYTLRIHLMGRDEPTYLKKGVPLAGLSALVRSEIVHIEVRSALYQNYAYIVQRADVHIPQGGYAAEVTIPMQPLSSGPSGRRERLHIFFMDEMQRPLYEKPFVVEIFISHLVQSGREGHNVLTIPL